MIASCPDRRLAQLTPTATAEGVATAVKAFHGAKKPIGLCCIAPVIAAKLIPGTSARPHPSSLVIPTTGVSVTVGSDSADDPAWPFAGTAKAIESMGATHVVKGVSGPHAASGC